MNQDPYIIVSSDGVTDEILKEMKELLNLVPKDKTYRPNTHPVLVLVKEPKNENNSNV